MILATGGIHPADWVVVAVYFAGVIGMGVYFARRQRSTKEYFLGGRSMPPWVVGLSMIATLLSTISYLAVPGEMIKHGPAFQLSLLALPLAFVLVGYLFIPFFMRLPITSAYEYLESRFGVQTRMLGAVFFILIRIVWMSVVVYTASGAMAKMTGMPFWIVIVGVGVFTTFYAAFGGIRAVIWTDVIQFIVLFGGAVFAVGYVTWQMGFGSWVSVAYENTRLNSPVWSWDPTERLSVIGIVINTLAWFVFTYGSDQVVVQRYLTTRDAPSARRSFLVCCIGDVGLAIVLSAVGFAMLAFYTHHAHLLTGEFAGNLKEQADHVFPYFIANQLPVGLTGLIIAALFAAAMSSLDSGVNSVSAVITVDFYGRFWGRGRTSDQASLSFAKVLGLALGMTATGLAFLVDNIEGNIIEITNKSTSCVVAPLFGLFALGMFTRRANQFGVIVGAVVGLVVGLFVTFSGQWFDYNISFMWIMPSSIVVMCIVGYLASFLAPGPTDGHLMFTRRSVVSGAPPVMPDGPPVPSAFPVVSPDDD